MGFFAFYRLTWITVDGLQTLEVAVVFAGTCGDNKVSKSQSKPI